LFWNLNLSVAVSGLEWKRGNHQKVSRHFETCSPSLGARVFWGGRSGGSYQENHQEMPTA
jgi:hypothetical protein